MNIDTIRSIRGAALSLSIMIAGCALRADQRRFGYSYEPGTTPKGELEVEQWTTFRTQRDASVGELHFNRWEFKTELEYGLSERYSVSLYINNSYETFKDPASGMHPSKLKFDGVAVENRFAVLDSRDHPVGLTLYLEPRFSGLETELEAKLILGQRHGDWRWAFNLTEATEWSDHFRSVEGELEASFGIGKQFGRRWFVGLELRDHNELPDYKEWENTAIYFGPTATYRRKNWWATLTVMPQIYGTGFLGSHGSNRLDLEGHERLNVRLMFGFEF